MKIFVAPEYAYLIEKLQKVFADEEDVEFVIDRRAGDRRQTCRDFYIEQRKAERRQQKRRILWAIF